MRIRLSNPATRDLEALESYVAQDDPQAAIKMVLRVLEAIEGLAEFPNIGRPGRVPGTRELVVAPTPYVAVYRVSRNVIWVLRVLHGARRWPSQ